MPMEEIFNELQTFRTRLACPCCGENQTNDDFALTLLFAERMTGSKFVITSGYRCEKHNTVVPGGDPDSASLYGEHADIAYFSFFEAFKITKALVSAGFERLRVYDLNEAVRLGKKSAHIHVDRHPKHTEPILSIGTYGGVGKGVPHAGEN